MGETITLAGTDGFEFSAYHEPAFTPHKGGVIVLQEIFGIDRHVRADVERWAKMGYEAIAPSLFDRLQRNFTAEHDPAGLQAGIGHARATPLDQALGDIAACRDFLNKHGGKVHVVGYCYGGSLAWLSAAKVEGLAAASSYYGSLVQANAALKPLCPVIVHLGRTDAGIPADDVAAAMAESNPDVPVYIYEGAGHGFNNESPERYNAEAADLARHRTLELFDKA
ncbi:MAG: dienelactone hydrolase family protein [Alphaproteobacteria bacterium]|nr:dienelactone hydrolase family protein [Alphaproteobacteria bacterium]MBU1515712.1 dienelactone hydrolase family protein [Alphaproteobacteria bacterium]MBU2096995.1 dienelactone hydrolase family protein [Alphaproteobacteria bacterium]MBU2149511.1 dienelactone hydrolase family protein [Alphaproteobacteria bacterium]MBU2308897.1 dienelactone hydrolase family protein [Alphaproteobacteria bacterium]